jgi:solute:Na+ symporter, SSS family
MDPLSQLSITVGGVDLAIIAAYLVVVFLAGILLTRMASTDIDSYFLGGHRMPWWLLGVSGTSAYFDVTGVMWTIAFFYIMGQRFFWVQWEWGFVAMVACFAAFMGKWLQRSRVITGAEWMIIRFGDGAAGRSARSAYAVLAVVVAVAFTGFAEWGGGQFLHAFLPQYSPHQLAVALIVITTIYTMLGGLYGVVVTDVIQFALILVGSTILIVKAIGMSSYEGLAKVVPPEWFDLQPLWRWERLDHWKDSSDYTFLFLLVVVWVTKGMLLSVGGPQQLYDMQRFLAARSPRDAAKAGMLWGVALTPMFMVAAAVGVIGLMQWGGNLTHPEKLYPVVIGTMLPVGLKGLVLAGLLSAFMSNFSATVNAGAAYLVRDGYQQLLRPKASQRELIHASRIASALVALGGIWVGMQAENIDAIFKWIMMVLGTAVLMPNVLRWFWWRLNGWGYAVGTVSGVAASIVSVTWFSYIPIYKSFFILLCLSIVTSIAAALLTPPTEMEKLVDFYRRIRPPGFWGPVKKVALAENPHLPSDSFGRDLACLFMIMFGLHNLYSGSCHACTKVWSAFAMNVVSVALSAYVLYFLWYKNLPEKNEGVILDPTGNDRAAASLDGERPLRQTESVPS